MFHFFFCYFIFFFLNWMNCKRKLFFLFSYIQLKKKEKHSSTNIPIARARRNAEEGKNIRNERWQQRLRVFFSFLPFHLHDVPSIFAIKYLSINFHNNMYMNKTFFFSFSATLLYFALFLSHSLSIILFSFFLLHKRYRYVYM